MSNVKIPSDGAKITVNQDGTYNIPDNPIITFIEGDGIGPDLWRASVRVFDAAVEKTFKGSKKISWAEVYAGEKALEITKEWLPQETTDVISEYLVSTYRGMRYMYSLFSDLHRTCCRMLGFDRTLHVGLNLEDLCLVALQHGLIDHHP